VSGGAVEVRELWADYGAAPVLRGVSFAVQSGEFLGVLGPNACGKSTLIRVLSGVLAPRSGEVHVAGLSLSGARADRLARAVATVPQSTEIPFAFTGLEVVSMGRYPHIGRFSAPQEADRRAVRWAMEETDTVSLAGRPVTQVSGGERQRLVLARALAQETPVLLLDEATAALDVRRKMEAFDLLTALNDRGSTVLAVMHDLNLAALYCRRLLFLKDGRVAKEGPTGDVFTKETVEAVYDTPAEVSVHPSTDRPYAVFLPGRSP
jgi:iron complex transport system ATP-binding protein